MSEVGILNAIHGQIELERKKILDPAAKKVEEILAKAQAEAERITSGVRSRKGSGGTQITQVSPLVLKVKQEGMDRVFAKALEELNQLRKRSDYSQVFEKLLKEACVGFEGTVDILVNPADVKLAKNVASKLKISGVVKADDSIGAGVTVSKDGKVFNHNTFADRCKKVRIRCSGEVANILYA